MQVNATTACLPGTAYLSAVRSLLEGIEEPALGRIRTDHMQLCPQNAGVLDERMCEQLRQLAPNTTLRLHANAAVFRQRMICDASTYSPETHFYYEALADRSKRLGATGYSLHAGRQRHATREQMLETVKRLNDLFGIPVGVEGLYPNRRDPQLIDCWADYAWLLEQDIPFAIDLSHLKIVARAERYWDFDIVRSLLSSQRCIEVHVSDNDGLRDSHSVLTHDQDWTFATANIHPGSVVFTEGNQFRQAHSHTTKERA